MVFDDPGNVGIICLFGTATLDRPCLRWLLLYRIRKSPRRGSQACMIEAGMSAAEIERVLRLNQGKNESTLSRLQRMAGCFNDGFTVSRWRCLSP